MKPAKLAVLILAAFGSGHASAQALSDCFQSNYDADLKLFTIRNAVKDPVNQQCILSVGPRSQLRPGRYTVHVSNGGGGGAGGTWQGEGGMGGGGGGGAGAREIQTTVNLTEGAYKLTIGAGGPGGNACVLAPFYIGGSPGWPGSPSSIVRIANGELVAGIPGADAYRRPSRAQLERLAGQMDGHGGGGPGQTSGGRGGNVDLTAGTVQLARPGEGKSTRAGVQPGGIPGGIDGRWVAGGGGGLIVNGNSAALDAFAGSSAAPPALTERNPAVVEAARTSGVVQDLTTAGGGGGASTLATGGSGGGEPPGARNRAPQRGALGSGGGGGEGSKFECDPGAPGGHGFIALRPAA